MCETDDAGLLLKLKYFLTSGVKHYLLHVQELFSPSCCLSCKHCLFRVLVLLLFWCLSFLLELMGKCPYLHLPSPPWIKPMSLYFTCFPASNAVKWKTGKTNAIIPHIPSFLLPPAASVPPDALLIGQGEKQERSWHCINNKTLVCYQGCFKHIFNM